MKRLGFLLLGLCLTAGAIATVGCGDSADKPAATEPAKETPGSDAKEEGDAGSDSAEESK